MKTCITSIGLILISSFLITSCNTVEGTSEGMTKDIRAARRAINSPSDRDPHYRKRVNIQREEVIRDQTVESTPVRSAPVRSTTVRSTIVSAPIKSIRDEPPLNSSVMDD